VDPPGCPLPYPLFFVITIKLLAHSIRRSKNINGFNIKQKQQVKLKQKANNNTIFLAADIQSVLLLLLFYYYYYYYHYYYCCCCCCCCCCCSLFIYPWTETNRSRSINTDGKTLYGIENFPCPPPWGGGALPYLCPIHIKA